jgi:hypothetical protein
MLPEYKSSAALVMDLFVYLHVPCPVCDVAVAVWCKSGSTKPHPERIARAIEWMPTFSRTCKRCKVKPGEACKPLTYEPIPSTKLFRENDPTLASRYPRCHEGR